LALILWAFGISKPQRARVIERSSEKSRAGTGSLIVAGAVAGCICSLFAQKR
jgi:hypothetical protein